MEAANIFILLTFLLIFIFSIKELLEDEATCLSGYSCWTFSWRLASHSATPPCASTRGFECFTNALMKLPDTCSCLLQHQTQLLLTTCTKISLKHFHRSPKDTLYLSPKRGAFNLDHVMTGVNTVLYYEVCCDWCKYPFAG